MTNYNDLLSIGILFVTLGIALTYGVDIMTDVQEDVRCPDSYVYNASATLDAKKCYLSTNHSQLSPITDAGTTIGESITSVGNVSEKSGTLTTVLMASIIIGTLIGAFAFGRMAN